MESNTKKIRTEWNLSPLFRSDNDPGIQAERKKIEESTSAFIKKWKDNKGYLNNPLILRNALDEFEELENNFGNAGKEGLYFMLRSSIDQDDPKIKAKLSKLNEFWQKIENEMQFFEHSVAKIAKEQQRIFLAHKELEKYRHFLERLFENAKYMLSEKEEKILNLKNQSSYVNWVKMTSGFLSKEERKVITENGKAKSKNFSEIISLMDSQDKKTRDSAAEAFNDILKKYAEVAEAEINSILEDKKVEDELRGLNRPDLSRHIADDIESSVIDSLREAVSEGYRLSNRYYELKAKLLGLKKLKYHERNIPYGKLTKKYTYVKAAELVYNTFLKLDEEFAEIFISFCKNGQIDVYPKKGKNSGAFCAGSNKLLPSYVLLNHDESLNDVLTIAHEMGHAINNELMRKKVNALYFETPLSTAEVASTFMEDFVLEELLRDANPQLKLSILMMKLNSDVSSIFRQVACYNFELEMHENYRKTGYLSKEDIGKIFQKHMSLYMGKSVELSEGSENWWVYWGHIRNYFYVYSYASGQLISKSLQNSVKKDPKFISKVKEFLSMGESDSPKNIFLKLGIDITKKEFWDNGLGEIEQLLDETENLARKIKKNEI